MLSVPHMIVVFVVVLVVFGPQKLPELARGLGKLMAEFRKASTDFKSAFEEEMREMERQAMQAERKKAAEAAAASAAATETSPVLSPSTSAGTEAALTEPESNSQITTPTEEPAGAMTFFEHLSELRKRIINSLIAVVIGALIGWI